MRGIKKNNQLYQLTLTLIVLIFSVSNSSAQSSISIDDTRDVVSTPKDYYQIIKPHFKLYTTLGIPEKRPDYPFYTILGLHGWRDDSGGKAHELAFGNENNMYVRSGYEKGWENWRKILAENLNDSGSTIRIGNSHTPLNINVPVGGVTGGYNIDFSTWREVVPDQIGARIRAERINSYHANNALIQSVDLVFHTSNGIDADQLKERLRIKSDGTVGIGTNNPQGYMLAVKGKIRTQEIKVDASNWPDYVFSPSHQKPSLDELERFINTNKHLPEIPSAEKVEAEGVDLGEMNVKLLKKIEELTLYLIEQGKEIEKLKLQVAAK